MFSEKEANFHCSFRQIRCFNNYTSVIYDEFWTMIFLFRQNFTSFSTSEKEKTNTGFMEKDASSSFVAFSIRGTAC